MTGYLLILFLLLAVSIVAWLVLSGWGVALLLWPFGIRPLFPAHAKLTEIYGMDPATCDINEFQARHHALWDEAEASKLGTLNKMRLRRYFNNAAQLILPRLSAMTARARAVNLEFYADQQGFAAPHEELLENPLLREKVLASLKASEPTWRQILQVKDPAPSRKVLLNAFEKALSDVQASPKATQLVEAAMSQAMAELEFVS